VGRLMGMKSGRHSSRGVRFGAILALGLLAGSGVEAASATATGRASARIISPTRVAVTSASQWSASIESTATGRTVETMFGVRADRPRDFSVGVRLEKNDAAFGTSSQEGSGLRVEEMGISSATRLRVTLPDAEPGAGSERSHVRIVMHNY
ncbi:MAG: hypothetical protein LC732_07850, partial [Acidobacteria bacterium]|nr:hypothetical protein [Acidobacteriota bacterium]